MFVRQFLAFVVLFGAVMIDVEKIAGHGTVNLLAECRFQLMNLFRR
jgi:hypothetical protein